jgi:hypothetical protein
MSDVDVDKWFMNDLVDATLPIGTKKKRKIDIPRFQRRRVWNEKKENALIDSLQKNFPISNFTLYKARVDDNCITYILIDGLQRSITLIKYIQNPLEFKIIQTKIDSLKASIIKHFNKYSDNDVKSICNEWFTKKNLGDYVQIISKSYATKSGLLRKLIDKHLTIKKNVDKDKIMNLIFVKTEELSNFINLSKCMIPVTIINCSEHELYEVYERLNTAGTTLKRFEIMAAAWYKDSKCIKVNNKKIKEAIDDYYNEELKHEGEFDFDLYKEDDIGRNCRYNCFEYIVGLHKYLMANSQMLHNKYFQDYEFTFKLVATCVSNDHNSFEKIPLFLKDLVQTEELDNFETTMCDAIKFCDEVYTGIIYYKCGKTYKFTMSLDTLQIIGMLTTYFKNSKDISSSKSKYIKQFRMHILNDKLINRMRGSGKQILQNIINKKIYVKQINYENFIYALNQHFSKELLKISLKKNVSKIDKIILMLITNIKNKLPDDDKIRDFDHIVSLKAIKDFNNNKNGRLQLNHIGNICFVEIFNKKKGGGSNLNILAKYEDMSKIYKKYVYVNNTAYDELIEDLDINAKTYDNFIKERTQAIIKILSDDHVECFTRDTVDDGEEDSDDSDGKDDGEEDSEDDTEDDSEDDSEDGGKKDSKKDSKKKLDTPKKLSHKPISDYSESENEFSESESEQKPIKKIRDQNQTLSNK